MNLGKLIIRKFHTMRVKFLVPQSIETIKQGYVGEIKVIKGQQIKKDDVVMEIETDKATIKERSPVDGIICDIYVNKDETIPDKTYLYGIDYKKN